MTVYDHDPGPHFNLRDLFNPYHADNAMTTKQNLKEEINDLHQHLYNLAKRTERMMEENKDLTTTVGRLQDRLEILERQPDSSVQLYRNLKDRIVHLENRQPTPQHSSSPDYLDALHEIKKTLASDLTSRDKIDFIRALLRKL